jgi:hypothetical protein
MEIMVGGEDDDADDDDDDDDDEDDLVGKYRVTYRNHGWR